MNIDGFYQSSGKNGTVLQGTFIASETGTYTATLQYEMIESLKDIPAYFEISVTDQNNNVVVYNKEMEVGQTEVTIEGIMIQSGEIYKVSVVTEEGTVLQLKQIDYYAKSMIE